MSRSRFCSSHKKSFRSSLTLSYHLATIKRVVALTSQNISNLIQTVPQTTKRATEMPGQKHNQPSRRNNYGKGHASTDSNLKHPQEKPRHDSVTNTETTSNSWFSRFSLSSKSPITGARPRRTTISFHGDATKALDKRGEPVVDVHDDVFEDGPRSPRDAAEMEWYETLFTTGRNIVGGLVGSVKKGLGK